MRNDESSTANSVMKPRVRLKLDDDMEANLDAETESIWDAVRPHQRRIRCLGFVEINDRWERLVIHLDTLNAIVSRRFTLG